jgi:hypothetical protein
MILTLQKDGTIKRVYEKEDITHVRLKIIKAIILCGAILVVATAATVGGCNHV